MNERIFELIQAQNGFSGLVWTEQDKQEFAELIVTECLMKVHGAKIRNESYTELIERFKEDFGVEL